MVLGGGQGGAFGATLDGISVNTNRNADTTETAFLTPSVEAITEFSVETNGFKPEFGQAGGGAITFASKSGTNSSRAPSTTFSATTPWTRKASSRRRRASTGRTISARPGAGRCKIPRLYDGKNRTFFFAAYEGFMNNQASNALTLSVPTPEMYDGDFSNWVDSQGRLLVIYDPATTRPNPNGTGFIRDPFPGNRIPANRFSAVARQYLALARSAVVPNRAGLVPGTVGYVSNNYLSPGGTTKEKTNKYSVKIDHALSNAHRLSYLFNRTANNADPGESGAAGLPAPFNTFQSSSFDARPSSGSWDWIVGSRMVNHLSVGMNTFNKNAFSPNVDQNWKDRVCIPNAVDCNQNFGIISFSEFVDVGRIVVQRDGAAAVLDQGRPHDQPGVAHDQVRVHLRPAAGEWLRPAGYRRPGRLQLPGNGRAGCDDAGQRGGSSFASFLLGAADTGRTETIRYLQQIYPYYGFYAQDDWRRERQAGAQLRRAL